MAERAGDNEQRKACCARFYENGMLAALLGDRFHPGGRELTLTTGAQLGLGRGSKVLDVACGSGTSALDLAEAFGCRVVGIDLSEANLKKAEKRAALAGLSGRLQFLQSDAERLPFGPAVFDAVISECSLCTFPDAAGAVSEMHRCLKPGGRLGISDVTIEGGVPGNWKTAAAIIACLGGARSAAEYETLLTGAGFVEVCHENHADALHPLLEKATSLVGVLPVIEEALGGGLKDNLGFTAESAKKGIDEVRAKVEEGRLGYGLFTAVKG